MINSAISILQVSRDHYINFMCHGVKSSDQIYKSYIIVFWLLSHMNASVCSHLILRLGFCVLK